jgi:putative ABC transport system permease protein
VEKVWYKNTLSGTVSYGETSANTSCSAIEIDYLQSYGLQLAEGVFFSITDDIMGMQKIILGSDIASALFPNGDAIGKDILLYTNNVPFNFQVVGILKEQNAGMENSSTGSYIPRGFYLKKINPNVTASNIMVQASSNSKAQDLVESINKFCLEKTGTEGSVRVSSMQTMIDQMSEITNTMSVMLSAIAAISLLVGGIGIMNIMIVTVTERKQEIGIRKALGASPSIIKQQFLVESASITLVGGIIGILLGILISIAVEFVQGNSLIISWESCIIAFAFSVFVGVFFGLSPASRAAKLDPVVALSGE